MSALRDDLMHLSPEALMQASNAGIVKRAMRELAGGYRPAWTESEGVLAASFSDGIRLAWPPATPIQHVRCSCQAASVCRHRIIVALAYREEHAQQADAAGAESPGHASEEAIAQLLPAALLARARAMRDAGLAVDVHRRGEREPCDTARLPAATVRFWAGSALAAARCDCVAAAACEHVALGVWAFRAADAQDPGAQALRVRLGREDAGAALDRAPWLALAEALLRHGVAEGPAPLSPALSQALAAARAHDATWLVHCLQDLERWSAAYASRSALYQPEDGLDLIAELSLRLGAGALPANAHGVLGAGVGDDSELDRLRLVCLGARTTRDGERRHTRLVLADADTGTAMLLSHDWKFDGDDAAAEATVRATQRLAPGVRLEALAQGQLLARQARRRADGSLALARSRSALNSVLPQSPDWSMLRPPLRYESVADLRAQQQSHPTTQVLPRHAARRFVIFTPHAQGRMVYDPGPQAVAIVLTDARGEALLVQRTHQSHVAHALDALAAAFAGARGPVRHVAGLLHWSGACPVLEPWALACDEIVVPDFAATSGALEELPLGRLTGQGDHPVAAALAALRTALAELLHHGLVQLPSGWSTRCAATTKLLAAQGLHRLAAGLASLAEGVTAARANPRDAQLAPALLELAALRQLHDDALVLAGLAA